MVRLADAEWTRSAHLTAITKALGADAIRWVGGAVRDTLLELPVHDVDCATTHHPEEVIKRLKAARIKVVPTGIEHGTITAIVDGNPVEVTTLRRDVATDGRRATVAFAEEWREDAARRDFTINALYAHPETLEIDDYFGGLEDLEVRRVRFIGDARERIREDHLRILRYFRFQARFGSELDEEAEAACADLASTLKGLSRERVAMELLNLLSLADPAETVRRMAGLGVLEVVLPEANSETIGAISTLVKEEGAQNFEPDGLRRLAALLPPEPDVAETVASRLRLSRKQRARLSCVAARTAKDSEAPQALAYREGMDCAIDRLLLGGADTQTLRHWSIPQLPMKGGAIVAKGIEVGPEVAAVLQQVEARWVVEGFPDKTRVDAILDEVLAERA